MSLSFQQRWRSREQLFSCHAPEVIRSWLFDRSSLTARLIRHCNDNGHGRFSVKLLEQKLTIAKRDEREVLGIGNNRGAIVRQVKLYCGETPMVYARTVIPVTTLTGKQRLYGNLGSRPLGAMLFSDNSMRRDEVMVTCLRPEDELYASTGADGQPVWGRRSVFYVGGKPLLVSEYYLPSLFD